MMTTRTCSTATPCLPNPDPNDETGTSFIRSLLLSQALCGAVRTEVQWRDTSPTTPLTGWICRDGQASPVPVLPGMAILRSSASECHDLGGPGIVMTSGGLKKELQAQVDAAVDDIIASTNARTDIDDAGGPGERSLWLRARSRARGPANRPHRPAG
jgi:hypothetical protein